MGLDMYLEAEAYISNHYSPDERDNARVIELTSDLLDLLGITGDEDTFANATMRSRVGYWRKANQIHNWFVNHVQGGHDDCKDYWVSRDQLRELRHTCKRVLAGSPVEQGKINIGSTFSGGKWVQNTEDGAVITDTTLAEKELPTSSGFFFGGTDYDEYYLQDLSDTIKIIDRVLEMPESIDFYYRASW